MDLSVDPLPGDEPLELSAVPGRVRERVQVISEQVDDVAARLFDDEVRTACRRLLVRAVAAEPGLLREPSRDEVVPAAVLWAVGKANDLVGPGRQMPVSAITALCGLKSAPTERGKAFAHAVAGPRGVGFERCRYAARAGRARARRPPTCWSSSVPPPPRHPARPGRGERERLRSGGAADAVAGAGAWS